MRNVPVSYYATITGSLAIAVGLVVVSYGHIRKFAQEAGAAAWEAAVIAVTVDALVVLSIAAIGHARGVGHKPPAMAKVALVVGIVATTGANIHHGLDHGWAGIVVSLWVPVAAELAYQLAMSAVRVGADGGHVRREVRPDICGGRLVPVSAVMARVSAVRAASEEAAAREAAAAAARPVICGRTVPVSAVTASLSVDVPDIRPDICGALVPLPELVASLPVPPVLPVICGHEVPVSAVVEALTEDRPVICGHQVSVSEVLARTPVTAPEDARPHAGHPDTAPEQSGSVRRSVTAAMSAAREEAVMEWLTDPDAPDTRMTTATGADIVELLSARGLGTVTDRTGRRLLRTVRAAMGEQQLAAV